MIKYITGISLRVSFFVAFLPNLLQAQQPSDLKEGFINPTNSYRPIVWWHWTGSNVTKEGISKDLAWMKRSGIGGFQAFDVSIGGGHTIESKVKYLSPEWLALIKHTVDEAERLGLDMTMFTAAGWSETGGTWVKPHEAMKKLVWSETKIKGGKIFNGILPIPPTSNGLIRDLPKRTALPTDPTYFADQKVLAFKTTGNSGNEAKPKITNERGEVLSGDPLLDDNLSTKISMNVPKQDKPVYLQYEFEKPFKARSFSFAMLGTTAYPSTFLRAGYVQSSEDGVTYKTLFPLPGPQHDIRALPVRTISFPEVTAKYYRVVFTTGNGNSTVGGPDDFGGFRQPASPPTSFDLSEAIFSTVAKINRWEDKANFGPMFTFEELKTPHVPITDVIKTNEVLDLTSKMKPDGSLTWTVPAGNWTIMRFGYSLTGAKNSPAMPDATGYEVDKLSKTHLESYLTQWVKPIKEAVGKNFGKSLKYFLIDSYESDAQNWTESMLAEFKSRRGYDPTPYLPAFAGKIVGSAEVSDRFLWDFRLTFAELLVDNHYAAITNFAHKEGILTYGEVAGISMPIIQDALRTKNAVDIPMGEFGMGRGLGSDRNWTTPADLETQKAYGGANERLNAHQSDIREAASAAHVYGKKVVAAEAWTGGGYEAPADMKFIGDYWMTQGINQIVFHTSAHQPLDTKPGNVMVGTHFHRNITWAEQAKPFVDYITRNQYMLQQGRSVADIAYYLGEDIPAVVPYWEKLKNDVPEGFDYDYVNAEILMRFEVENGELVLPSGVKYKVLVLPEKQTMTLPILTKIVSLVKKGAIIVGPKPEKSPSLMDYPGTDILIANLANELWGAADGKYIYQATYGQGKIFNNAPLIGILGQLNVKPDVIYTKPNLDTKLTWIHRKTADADIYFVLNVRNHPEDLLLKFRTEGKRPELWYSDEGISKPVSYKMSNGTTQVKLHIGAQESVFVVFKELDTQKEVEISDNKPIEILNISQAWKVSFSENIKYPLSLIMDPLVSWSNRPEQGIKYYSGTAIYRNDFDLDKSLIGKKICLDLGIVKDIATVIVNGKELGTLWKLPYQIDLSNVIREGKNSLEIKVTNQWDNRIIGDKSLPNDQRVLSFTPTFGVGQKLKESGLLGPLVLKVR
ncbi:glycosyl hydrolase [Aquirufa sp. Wall-65K1]